MYQIQLLHRINRIIKLLNKIAIKKLIITIKLKIIKIIIIFLKKLKKLNMAIYHCHLTLY